MPMILPLQASGGSGAGCDERNSASWSPLQRTVDCCSCIINYANIALSSSVDSAFLDEKDNEHDNRSFMLHRRKYKSSKITAAVLDIGQDATLLFLWRTTIHSGKKKTGLKFLKLLIKCQRDKNAPSSP